MIFSVRNLFQETAELIMGPLAFSYLMMLLPSNSKGQKCPANGHQKVIDAWQIAFILASSY